MSQLIKVGHYKGPFDGYTVMAERFVGPSGEYIWTIIPVHNQNGSNTGKYWVSGEVFRELLREDIWGSKTEIEHGQIITSNS